MNITLSPVSTQSLSRMTIPSINVFMVPSLEALWCWTSNQGWPHTRHASPCYLSDPIYREPISLWLTNLIPSNMEKGFFYSFLHFLSLIVNCSKWEIVLDLTVVVNVPICLDPVSQWGSSSFLLVHWEPRTFPRADDWGRTGLRPMTRNTLFHSNAYTEQEELGHVQDDRALDIKDGSHGCRHQKEVKNKQWELVVSPWMILCVDW